MKILLDSVVLIDHLNGIERATQFISRNAGRLAVSVVTRAEVLAGIKPRSLSR
ncbi:MAG: PIN domain nuclease, partial [Burkholderiales bacterium]|nr:PIN domain nuclease [Burkholderiales bacterium]